MTNHPLVGCLLALGGWLAVSGVVAATLAYTVPAAADLSTCTHSQKLVRAGARVTIIGPFSSAKAAIVPPSPWQSSPRIIIGDSASVMTTLAATARTHLLLALVTGVVGGGLFITVIRSL